VTVCVCVCACVCVCVCVCARVSDGEAGTRHLFRVKDPGLRARVALQALERWPLCACLELLEFCLNDPDTEAPLRAELEGRRKELDIYRWVRIISSQYKNKSRK